VTTSRQLAPLVICCSFLAAVASAQEDSVHAPIRYDFRTPRNPGLLANNNSGLPHFHVTFHGGPVQTTTTSFAIYWKPVGAFMNKTYQQVIDQFLTNVGGSPVYGYATEYAGSNGQVQNSSTFGGSFVDTTPYPARITTKDIEATIEQAISTNNWQPGITAQFFLFLGLGPQVGACAYHTVFMHDGAPVIYAVLPYFDTSNAGGCGSPFGISPNNNFAADSTIGNLSHEQTEMVTDPLLNAWYDPVNGEVGDICIYSYGVPFTSGSGNLATSNGHQYIVQEEWSEKHHSCQPNL
jgi:hypothetical protein